MYGYWIDSGYSLGDSTTRFDITNPTGITFRYTYDGTGTDPLITTNISVGATLNINAQNFAAGNKGNFTVIAVGANYFEITNSGGAVESDKTIGTGSIVYEKVIELTVSLVQNLHRYKAELLSSGTSIKFYVDNVLTNTISVPEVIAVDTDYCLTLASKQTVASAGDYFYVFQSIFYQDY